MKNQMSRSEATIRQLAEMLRIAGYLEGPARRNKLINALGALINDKTEAHIQLENYFKGEK